MTQPKSRTPNIPDKHRSGGPQSSLEVMEKAIESTDRDQFLSDANLGLGNYKDAEMWQQIESYKAGMFAEAAFSETILERAIDEAKVELALNGWTFWSEDENRYDWKPLEEVEGHDEESPDDIRERGETIWHELPDAEKAAALEDLVGLTGEWTNPFYRMMMARHETSRSRDARLIDNIFGRIRHVISENDDGKKKGGILSRNRGESR
ncbi:hypothetical protein [Haloferax sp. Atlit-12N]|uniref:hypothetical protein n=1 Tax=Haloferax sp. Atlit-12N TaxID=2077203 RepID=UPI0011E5C9A4|nr:hypothetical protein [Haloferax sp. Atlit-12N]